MTAPVYRLTVTLDGERVATLRGLTPPDAVRWRRAARSGLRFEGAVVELAHGAAVVRERCDGARWRRV